MSTAQIALARGNLLAALSASASTSSSSSDEAPETAEAALARRVTFAEGDMMSLSFPAGSLAGAVGFYSLIHLPRSEQAEMVERVHGWLRPGGLILVNFAAEDMEYVVMDRWLDHDDGWMFWSGFGAEGSLNLFEEIGFEILSREIKTEEGVAGASFLWVLARKKR
jgi:hypothetical protein